MSEEPKQFVVRHDGRAIRFRGWKIGGASSHSFQGPNQNRWVELDLWETTGGNYVCRRSHISQWQGESEPREAATCSSLDQVFSFFGHDPLAQELFADAEIDDSEEID